MFFFSFSFFLFVVPFLLSCFVLLLGAETCAGLRYDSIFVDMAAADAVVPFSLEVGGARSMGVHARARERERERESAREREYLCLCLCVCV